MNIDLRKAITETLDILEHMEKKDVDKIPDKFMKYLEDNKSIYYKPNLDHTKRLCEMNLNDKTKSIMSFIYINFWCDEKGKKDAIYRLKKNQYIY